METTIETTNERPEAAPPQKDEEDILLDRHAAMKLLGGIGNTTFTEMRKKYGIPEVRIGRRLFFRKRTILRLIERLEREGGFSPEDG